MKQNIPGSLGEIIAKLKRGNTEDMRKHSLRPMRWRTAGGALLSLIGDCWERLNGGRSGASVLINNQLLSTDSALHINGLSEASQSPGIIAGNLGAIP